ncbi:diguanylate cyclase [Variovorax sp. RHLX14]|uniref:sensor domain-containing diguanylate cyclase n=1 Tax=Variovorax sp. RHLX14 TaxID=1259731 RepID=UPI003F488691
MTLSGVAALALGIGLIAFLLVGRAERDMLAVEREREIGEAVRTATVLSHRVIEVQRTLQALAMQAEGGSLEDPATLERFIQSTPLLKDIFALLFMTSKEGRVRVYVDDKGVQHPNIDISDRPYFRKTLSDGKPQISDVIYSRLDGTTGVVFTQPIRNEAGIYGMLAGSVRLNSRGLLDSVVTTQSGYTSSVTVVVTNADGTILAHPDKHRVAQSLATEPHLEDAFRVWTDSGSPVEPQGLLLAQAGEVVSVAGVPGPDWVVWRVRDEAQLLAPLRDARRHALIIAGALVIVLSVAMFAWLGWLLAPLTLLKNRAQHLFDGEVQPQEGWPAASGEIGSLGRVLRRVAIERARLENLNAQMLGRLRSVMSAAPVGIAIARQDHFELAGDTFCQLFCCTERDLLDRSTRLIFASAEDHAAFTEQEREAFAIGGVYAGEWRMRRSDGTQFWARLRSKMVDGSDASMGAIWIVSNIDEQRAQREQLEWSATHDPLTGLSNRLAFTDKAEQMVAGLPHTLPTALVFIDLDNFKPVNDTAGHLAGDLMLLTVATAISAHTRSTDLVVRLGGDEFALVLERCSHESALRIAEEVRDAVAGVTLPWEEGTLRVGASLGVASLTAETRSVAEWLAAADAACYAAKAAGRGTVQSAGR